MVACDCDPHGAHWHYRPSFFATDDTLLIPYDYHVGKKMGFTIQVVDENAVPVPDALVKGKRYRMFEGTTDPSGKYFWASSSQTVKWFQISKPGYYKTTDPQRNPVRISEQLDASASRTLVVTLKSARNPVPMYAKRAAIEVPGPGDYGYDLMAGALIPPRGNGRITDIIIHIEQVPENNYLLADLRFPGSGNGIRRFDAHHEHGYVPRQSEFIFPYEAPTDGYVHSTSAADATAENKDWGYRSDYANYTYRVRSTEPRGPFYGKIYGMTEVSGLTVHFTYYLNPDGTRNLEWDRTRNLFEHLSRGEHAPQYP